MWLGEKLVIRFFSLVKNIVWLIRTLTPFFSQVRKFVSVFPAFRGGHASNLYLCHWRENFRVALLRFFHNVSRLQQGLLMLALSKILFFNTRINRLFKKQKEMSSFYSHFWKKKKKMKKEKWKTFPADDLKTYISKFIIATEPRRPWKRLKCIEDSPGK